MTQVVDHREAPMEALPYEVAVQYVEKWMYAHILSSGERERGVQVEVCDYLDRNPAGLKMRPFAGVRVAEVSFHTKSGGGSYMQSDMPWGIAVCGQVERCILALVEGWNKNSYESEGHVYGETDEEFGRLEMLFEETKTASPSWRQSV